MNKALSILFLSFVALTACSGSASSMASSEDTSKEKITFRETVSLIHSVSASEQSDSPLYLLGLSDFPTYVTQNIDCSHVLPGDLIEYAMYGPNGNCHILESFPGIHECWKDMEFVEAHIEKGVVKKIALEDGLPSGDYVISYNLRDEECPNYVLNQDSTFISSESLTEIYACFAKDDPKTILGAYSFSPEGLDVTAYLCPASRP